MVAQENGEHWFHLLAGGTVPSTLADVPGRVELHAAEPSTIDVDGANEPDLTAARWSIAPGTTGRGE